MKDGVFSLDELKREKRKREKNNDYFLSGKTGCCFIRGDKIIKLYNYSKKYDASNDLTKYKSDRISFPIDYLYQKGKIIGDYFGNDSTEIEKRFSRFIKF